MANVVYGDISSRIAAYSQKQLLKRAIPYMVFERFGQAFSIPEHSTRTTIWRRYMALNPTPKVLVEGVTPTGQPMSKQDITCTMDQLGDVINLTDVILDTHEDPVLNESIDLIAEQSAQMIETMRYGVLRAGTNVVFANGVQRSAVNTPFSLALQRRATKALKRQNARPITKVLRSTAAYGTEAVARSYIGFIHPDMENDIRNAVGADGKSVFTPIEKYGAVTPFENEIGKIEDVRYLSSTLITPFADAGGAAGLMTSTSGAKADVYPILIVAQDSYGIVALKGKFAITPIVVNPKPSDSDPLGQRGHVGWKAYQGAAILNDAWLVRLEVAVTA